MQTQHRKLLQGTVKSDRMQKTITVDVEQRYQHPKYGKYLVKTRRFAVHDEKSEAHVGDRVEITETRPLSRSKRWRLVRVLERAPRHDEGAAS